MIIDKEDRQNIRLALAAVFMHASLSREGGSFDETFFVRAALRLADALLAEFEKESP